jgi:hypothetical protein
MTEYKNLPEKYLLFNKPFKEILPGFALFFVGWLAFYYYTNNASGNFLNKDMIFQGVMFVVVFAVGFALSRSRQRQVFYSYKLTIDGESITRHQSNLPDISIPLNEITRIDQMNRDILIIRGQQKGESIVISPYIENYEELRILLEAYRPATPIVYKNTFQRYPALFGVLIIASMMLMYASNNKIVIGLSSIVLLSCSGWTFYKTHTTKQIDTGIKRLAWVTLVFFFFAAFVAYKKLVS